MSIRVAAETFGIPRSTLGDKLREKSAPAVTVRGKDPVLSKAVEGFTTFKHISLFSLSHCCGSNICNTKC